jgi:hypothetical protein
MYYNDGVDWNKKRIADAIEKEKCDIYYVNNNNNNYNTTNFTEYIYSSNIYIYISERNMQGYILNIAIV